MKCKKCGSENVQIQVINEQSLKTVHHSILWWIIIGFWWVPIKWLIFSVPALLTKIFGWGHKKQKIINKTRKKAVCQSCGNTWDV